MRVRYHTIPADPSKQEVWGQIEVYFVKLIDTFSALRAIE